MSDLRIVAALLLLGFTTSACSFIESSVSISDSIKSSSDSSASSSRSSGGDSEAAYRNDVRNYTYAFYTSGGNSSDFQHGLGQIAERHGITNWEEDMATYVGVGAGLGKAKVSRSQLEAAKQSLAAGSQKKQQALQRGYDAARSS